LNESFELAHRRGPLVQIDEVRLDPTLGEKRRAFLVSELFFTPKI
jgi:hypothetical protein